MRGRVELSGGDLDSLAVPLTIKGKPSTRTFKEIKDMTQRCEMLYQGVQVPRK